MSLLLFLKFYPGYNVLSGFGDLRIVNGLEFQNTCGHVRSKENFTVVAKVSVLALRGSRYCYFDRKGSTSLFHAQGASVSAERNAI